MATKPKDLDSEAISRFITDRPLAHSILFAGPRHKHQRPPFHLDLINDFHSKDQALRDLVEIVFRGGAKSTIAEEAIAIGACLREFNHCFIIGASLPQAKKRLRAVRRMFEKNASIRRLFGDLRGRPWEDTELEFTNGIVIQAMGRGQAIRGTKTEDFRPDLIVIDDIEDSDDIRTPESREKIHDWVMNELLPAADPDRRVRMLANDTHPQCLANKLARHGSGFEVKRYPWVYKDRETGEVKPTWPDRFPLDFIERERERYYSQGKASAYNANYLCRSEASEDKPFDREMFRYGGKDGAPAAVRTWEPVYAMFDPARSTSAKAATTGWAAWSKLEGRLIVWEAGAKRMMPDEIIEKIFWVNETFGPVKIGFEEDGLNQWALQPIRAEAAKRGIALPLVPVKAPQGKLDFIKALQYGFNARSTIFAKPLPELEGQLLSFPSGHMDAPNALAYEHHPKLSPGLPVYDDFGERHVIQNLGAASGRPLWLALNATPGLVTAVLVQMIDGQVRLIADWVREGDPPAVVADIHREVSLEAERGYKPAMGPEHYEFGNHGLAQAYKKLAGEIRRAPAPTRGREEMRQLMRRNARGQPALQVSTRARWTVNALAGGYQRAVVRAQVMDYPEAGTYKVLIEGLESFLGLVQTVASEEAGDGTVNATASDGRRFFSAVAHRRDAAT